jgi:serine/threonine protein phosphatase PrpC
MDSFTIQSSSGQDYSGHATFQDTSYAFVFDGHGYNDCIQHIRQLDINKFATLPCPPTALEASFSGKNFYKSGATFVLARITGTLLEVFHVGDAKAKVYVNDQLVHETIDHTFLLPSEISRTTAVIHDTKAPFPINDTHADMLDSPVGHFHNGEAFVPSQALGHNGISGLDPGHFVLEFKPYDSVRVVCGSDGFWDMLPNCDGTAKELCEHALSRWKQPWHFQGTLTHFDEPDDVSVSLLVHSPVICIPYSLSSFSSHHVRTAFPFPIFKVDEVVYDDHKLFFLHFQDISSELRELLKHIHFKKVKLYYHDSWFWHLLIRSSVLEQSYLDSSIPLDDYIRNDSILQILRFTSLIQSS